MPKFSEGSGDSGMGSEGNGGSGRSLEAQLEASLETDRRLVGSRYGKVAHAIRLVGGSPAEAQVEFMKGLLEDKAEARKFMENPKQYSVEHGVLLDPDVVQAVTESILFDVNAKTGTLAKLGTRGAQAVLDMRANHSVAAVPAAVVAGAAAVAAAAAVVEAVVTVVRTSKIADLHALKGLGARGIIMPGGMPFKF